MNILLTGFMGAGKTTVGRKLAKRRGYFFIDTDQEIEKEQGCSINDIFKYGGESCFRDMETDLLKKLQSRENSVLATGGGMVLSSQNRELMQSLGKRVYLKISFEEIFHRMRQDKKRPLFQQDEEKIREILEERIPIYEQAECIIDTHNMNSSQMVTEIILKI